MNFGTSSKFGSHHARLENTLDSRHAVEVGRISAGRLPPEACTWNCRLRLLRFYSGKLPYPLYIRCSRARIKTLASLQRHRTSDIRMDLAAAARSPSGRSGLQVFAARSTQDVLDQFGLNGRELGHPRIAITGSCAHREGLCFIVHLLQTVCDVLGKASPFREFGPLRLAWWIRSGILI